MKLTIELVPQTLWYSNLRKELPKADWDKLRKDTYRRAKYHCQICNGQGSRWPVECHEIWEYNDKKRVQILKGLIALCPACHSVKHMGFTQTRGHTAFIKAMMHLMKVNRIGKVEASAVVNDAFHTWNERSNHAWEQDLSWLKTKGVAYPHREGRT